MLGNRVWAAFTLLALLYLSSSIKCYSTPNREAEYCNDCVCVCVCLSVREHVFRTTRPIFAKFFVRITCGRGSVLWWRSDMLCIFGFVDDVVFAHKLRLLDVAPSLRQ